VETAPDERDRPAVPDQRVRRAGGTPVAGGARRGSAASSRRSDIDPAAPEQASTNARPATWGSAAGMEPRSGAADAADSRDGPRGASTSRRLTRRPYARPSTVTSTGRRRPPPFPAAAMRGSDAADAMDRMPRPTNAR